MTLSALEATIARGLSAWRDTGRALREIRDRKLYAPAYANFPAYCRDRWGIGRTQAYSIIEAADAADRLEARGLPVPKSINAARHAEKRPIQIKAYRPAPEPPELTAPQIVAGLLAMYRTEKLVEVARLLNERFSLRRVGA